MKNPTEADSSGELYHKVSKDASIRVDPLNSGGGAGAPSASAGAPGPSAGPWWKETHRHSYELNQEKCIHNFLALLGTNLRTSIFKFRIT